MSETQKYKVLHAAKFKPNTLIFFLIELILGRETLKTILQQFCGIHFQMPVGTTVYYNVIAGSKKVI